MVESAAGGGGGAEVSRGTSSRSLSGASFSLPYHHRLAHLTMAGGGPSAASSLYSGIFIAEERSSRSSTGKEEQETTSHGKEVKRPEKPSTEAISTESAAAPSKPQGSANVDKQYHAISVLSTCHSQALVARLTRQACGMN